VIVPSISEITIGTLDFQKYMCAVHVAFPAKLELTVKLIEFFPFFKFNDF
jgi:hypothetical protein